MIIETGILDLFGNNQSNHKLWFDISLLPLNLSEGRNIGDLPGLFLFKAPRKVESSRQADVFIVLFYVENIQVSESELQTWAEILAETYYTARGSFTMGINAAIKKLSAYLEKENKDKILPTIFLNAIVIRDKSLMIAHAGPVHTTLISADHVQNFNNPACLPIQFRHNELSFFTADIHSEDIFLLCPRVPDDWTNSAILDVAGDSPLNAIRFLLDRSAGNLQAAVIQLKSGKGNIIFRSKTTITANIQPEKIEDPSEREKSRYSHSAYSTDSNPSDLPQPERPLFRQRKSSELLNEFQYNTKPDTAENEESNTSSDETIPDEKDDTKSSSLTGDQELPGSEALPFNFSAQPLDKKQRQTVDPETEADQNITDNNLPSAAADVTENSQGKEKEKEKEKVKKKTKFNLGRFFVILFCGLFIPVIVVAVLFFVYSNRSNDQLHREYLELAVASAQKAITDADPANRESYWTESLGYVEQAAAYGSSPAAADLRKEAVAALDKLNGGIPVVYNYANRNKLPQGINLTEIASSGQYTYILDSASGSVLRFVDSGNGLSIDSSFNCSPGFYSATSEEESNIQVGSLIDFIVLPSGNPHSYAVAGIDSDANILYCSSFAGNKAAKLPRPENGRLEIKGITYSNNAMYVLDSHASTVWEYLYSNADGFIYDPSNYYGSYSPYLSDAIDFTMYKEYSYFLKDNGTLLFCDYTGYRPDCRSITEMNDESGASYINLSNHRFRRITINSSPDNSIYIMDAKLQTVLNISVKANFIRYITPNRTLENISQFSEATGFGITGQSRLLWGYKNDLYIGNMP